jgi:uncharacterized protein (DUF885 family)
MPKLSTALVLALLATAAPVVTGCGPKSISASQASIRGPEASKALAKVFADSDETSLRLSPLSALFRGDPRYAGQFGDYITDDYIAAQRQAQEQDWSALHRIDRASLSPDEQVAYDTFAYQTDLSRRGLTPEMTALTAVQPLDHLNGLHIQFPDISSGGSAAQFKTVADYENGLKRMDGFALYLDRCVERMREGMRTHVVQPKLVVRNMIRQLDTLVGQGVEKSPFWLPLTKLPADIGAADQARLKTAYRTEMQDKLIPVFKKLRAFLNDEYLPAARDSVGLNGLRGGDKLYALLAEQQTTTSMTPEQIHQLGLSEVARITAEMEKVKAEVGYQGDLHAFFQHLRTDAQFKPKTKDELRRAYEDAGRRIDAAIPRDFVLKPKAKLEIRPVPPYLETSQGGAYYNQGAPDGSRPGVFFFNTYDLPSRATWGVETLFLHEGVPGHHFQISLAQENEKLPKFMRFGGNTAFVEGWALYAESLGPELGMFTDPYQRFGHLNDEMLRAMRLVVDTGIHTKGWGRDQAIQYMLDNSAMGRTEATAEVERYIANPGQALAYKIGQLTIRRLRTKAEQALGPKFDVRAFHAQVLDTGALPMEVLEAKIDRWIATLKPA